MLPFLRHGVEITASLVNEETRREKGRHVIKVVQDEIEADDGAFALFNEQIPSTFSSKCKVRVCTELMLKIFHAQVNEYMSAVEEIQLEKEGKVVNAEQSLRDSLKPLILVICEQGIDIMYMYYMYRTVFYFLFCTLFCSHVQHLDSLYPYSAPYMNQEW